MREKFLGLFFLVVLCLALGYVAGLKQRDAWSINRVEPPAVAIRHESGAVTLERKNTGEPERIPDAVGERIRTITLSIPPSETVREIQIDVMQTVDGLHRVTVDGFPGITGTDYSLERKKEIERMWKVGAFVDRDGWGPMVAWNYRRATVWSGANLKTRSALIGLTISF